MISSSRVFSAKPLAGLTLFVLCVTSFASYATSDDELWVMLQKAAVAARALSYEGVFVYQTGQQAKAVQITHFFDGRNEFSRNVVLDGASREVLSQGSNLVIYNAKNEKIVIEKKRGQNMFPAMLPLNFDTIKDNYNVHLSTHERVADRQAQILFLEPKDRLRYSYKFWIDDEYGLLLKSVRFNQRSEIIESIGFNRVSLLNSVGLDWFTPRIDSKKSYVMADEPVILPDGKLSVTWEIKELPAGYRKVDQIVRMVPGKPYPVMHMIFSDGLATVSLFIEPTNKGEKTKVALASSGYTSFYAGVNHGYLVTAVGEVPEATVVQIANAVVIGK
ncbi:MucB/RseB C-terminal domain-containing protein [Methylotenera mobilis]|uniref:Putative sigma E regulatory protein, MucB/RseB n=1 Tax=Methylotenera mobilis (strain JLW8 / ATCC BAA-1282 / DSM 17540) TaxID=583345 RepID=C6WX94_METML|nr:MucB/RseB C-terminal domain-containing protein [Methylotenera mobilis]ACT48543.1 putative sigma E regulatory protein, MucB/RseB [Methylotenera mobilis JLW8]